MHLDISTPTVPLFRYSSLTLNSPIRHDAQEMHSYGVLGQ